MLSKTKDCYFTAQASEANEGQTLPLLPSICETNAIKTRCLWLFKTITLVLKQIHGGLWRLLCGEWKSTFLSTARIHSLNCFMLFVIFGALLI